MDSGEMQPVFNFAAGPAVLPREVLIQASEEMLDWSGSGMSILEMPFTGDEYKGIASAVIQHLRDLLAVPDSYEVLLVHGGASGQFSAVPMNLLRGKASADYIDTGHWSRKAIAEASRYCRVNVAASGMDEGYNRLPREEAWEPDPRAAYCHIVSNETANGTEYHWVPQSDDAPLVADMSSNILSKPDRKSVV